MKRTPIISERCRSWMVGSLSEVLLSRSFAFYFCIPERCRSWMVGSPSEVLLSRSFSFYFFFLLLRWCECLYNVYSCSLHSAFTHLTSYQYATSLHTIARLDGVAGKLSGWLVFSALCAHESHVLRYASYVTLRTYSTVGRRGGQTEWLAGSGARDADCGRRSPLFNAVCK
jgi:hypothetical protein